VARAETLEHAHLDQLVVENGAASRHELTPHPPRHLFRRQPFAQAFEQIAGKRSVAAYGAPELDVVGAAVDCRPERIQPRLRMQSDGDVV
jgi:hypothetical protein